MNISGLISGVPLLSKLRTDYLVKAYQDAVLQLNSDTLELSPEARLKSQSSAILSRFHKFDIQNYDSLSKVEKSILRNTGKDAEIAAEDSLIMGIKVKEDLDKRYGEDNYVFCSIGTSMSGVARVLEFMGVETKYLPISGLKYLYKEHIYRDYGGKFPVYGQFLKEQGITKEEIDSSRKQYLMFDFTNSGQSLRTFKQIMQEIFGIEGKNVRFSSADYECYAASAKKIDPEQYARDYVEKYMLNEEMEKYCGVAHLPIWELDKIDECKSYESENAKRFNFFLIDKLKRKGLLKYNPANKTSL